MTEPRHKQPQWQWGLVAITLAVCVLYVHGSISQDFEQLGAYNQYNLFFDADPNTALPAIAHGQGDMARSYIHPGFANLMHLPIGLYSAVHSLIDNGASPKDIQRQTALWVMPAITMISVLLMLLLFYRLRINLLAATALSALYAFSFSQLIFGSIPEHFAISGLILLTAFHLCLTDLNREKIHWPAWCLLATLAASITIINAALICIPLWVNLLSRRSGFWRAGIVTGGVAVVGIGLGLCIGLIMNSFYDDQYYLQPVEISESQKTTSPLKRWGFRYLKPDAFSTGLTFPDALANSIAPAAVGTTPYQLKGETERKYDYRFTLNNSPSLTSLTNLPGLIVLLLLLAGIWRGLHSRPEVSVICMSALIILLYNGLFHAAWGIEYFLYSQHWLAALVLLVAGFFIDRNIHILWTLAICGIVIFLGTHNLMLIADITDMLATG